MSTRNKRLLVVSGIFVAVIATIFALLSTSSKNTNSNLPLYSNGLFTVNYPVDYTPNEGTASVIFSKGESESSDKFTFARISDYNSKSESGLKQQLGSDYKESKLKEYKLLSGANDESEESYYIVTKYSIWRVTFSGNQISTEDILDSFSEDEGFYEALYK